MKISTISYLFPKCTIWVLESQVEQHSLLAVQKKVSTTVGCAHLSKCFSTWYFLQKSQSVGNNVLDSPLPDTGLTTRLDSLWNERHIQGWSGNIGKQCQASQDSLLWCANLFINHTFQLISITFWAPCQVLGCISGKGKMKFLTVVAGPDKNINKLHSVLELVKC